MTTTPSICVSCTSLSATILQKAQQQSKNLHLPYYDIGDCSSAYILVYTDERLELRMNPEHIGGKQFSPLFVDFAGGAAGYRHQKNCTINQPLARAVGIKSGFRPDVFDATAGLGGDGFVLASLGCMVTMNERSPILHALLEDGIARAAQAPRTADIVHERIRLLFGDSTANLTRLPSPPHTVYLDPMYPHSNKSALNKKEMRMIREIVGSDTDADRLLLAALENARNRVVVKRPKGAGHLGDKKPSHTVIMKNSRFDVYLTAHL